MNKKMKVFIVLDTVVVLVLTVFALVTYREWNTVQEARNEARSCNLVELTDGFTEYEIAGPENGPPLILIHGGTVGSYDWDFQFSYLADQGFRVIRYSHFGRDLSDRPDAVYDRNFYITQLNDLIDHFFDEPVHLVGHSFGGAIAVDYASSYEDKVSKIVLLAPSLNIEESVGGVSLIRIPLIGDYMALTVLSPLMTSRAEELFKTAEADITEQFTQLFDRQTRIKGFSRSVKSYFRNNAVEDYSDAYSKVEGERILLIWGDRDDTVPKEHIDRIEELNGDMEVIRLPGISHSLNFEIPDRINNQILRFFQSSLDRGGT